MELGETVMSTYGDFMLQLEAVPHLAIALPLSLGCVVASRRSLRNWLSIQAAPIEASPEPVSVARRLCRVIVALAFVGAIEYTVLATPYASQALGGIVACLQFSALYVFIIYITGSVQLAVVRRQGQAPRLRPVREPKLRRKLLGLTIPAGLLTFAAIKLPAYHPATMFASAALVVHTSSTGTPAPTITLRAMTIGVVCGEVALLTLSALLACILVATESGAGADLNEQLGLLTGVITESGFSRIIVAGWALWPALLLSVTRRFDYSQHIARGGEPVRAVETLDDGSALVPRRQRQLFKRPYFKAAMLTFVGIQYVLAKYGEEIGIAAKDDLSYALAVLFVSLPVLSSVIWAVALVRGEIDSLWKYREEWVVRTPPIALADDVEVDLVAVLDEKAAV